MPAWDEAKHVDLLLAFHACIKGEMTKAFQDEVVAIMKSQGHSDTNWDMIRYETTPVAPPATCQFSLHPPVCPLVLFTQSQTYLLQLSVLAIYRKQPSNTVTHPMPTFEEIKDDLLDAIYQVAQPLTAEQKNEVVAILKSRGHNMVWNAIR
jgi:hypothetical protein